MGIYKQHKEIAADDQQDAGKAVKPYITCMWPFFVSMTGGIILGFWDYEYHATYRQLWMVPLGLILFLTPVFVWFAVSVSELCMFDEERQWRPSQSVRSLGDDDSVHRDPER